MPYITTSKTKWFLAIGASNVGLATTIRGDGSYDGVYELRKKAWLIDRLGEQCEYPTFRAFWNAILPASFCIFCTAVSNVDVRSLGTNFMIVWKS